MEKEHDFLEYLELHDFLERTMEDDQQNPMFFPNDKNGFYTDKLSFLKNAYAEFPSAYMQNYYKVFLVTRGKILKTVQTKIVHIKTGELFISKPGQTNVWHEITSPEGYVVAFSKSFLHGLDDRKNMFLNFPYLSPISSAHFKMTDYQSNEMYGLMQSIHKEFEIKTSISYDLIRVKMMELLLFLKRYHENQTLGETHLGRHSADALIGQEFIEKLEEHIISGTDKGTIPPKRVSDFANELSLHPNQLNTSLKAYFGKTAKTLINERILITSKCKLLYSKQTMSEISYFLGFESPSYFNRFFKKYTKMTPSVYRSTYLEKNY